MENRVLLKGLASMRLLGASTESLMVIEALVIAQRAHFFSSHSFTKMEQIFLILDYAKAASGPSG